MRWPPRSTTLLICPRWPGHDDLSHAEQRGAAVAAVHTPRAHQALARLGLDRDVVPGVQTELRVGPADVGPFELRDPVVHEVGVEEDPDAGALVVRVGHRPAPDPDRAAPGVDRSLERAEGLVEAGPVVEAGGRVGACGGATRGVEGPRRGAGHHTAHDRSDAAHPLVALAVAEPGAAGLAVVAVALGAAARGAGAGAAADAVGAAVARAALGVAVQVVARRAAAELRAVDLPPSCGDRAGRTGVGAVERAAELGVAVAAQRTARAAGTVALTDRGVGRGRLQAELERGGHHCGADDRGLAEEAPAVEPVGEEVDGAIEDAGHLSAVPVGSPAGVALCVPARSRPGRSRGTSAPGGAPRTSGR